MLALYHGTDKNSALDIERNGVDLSKSRPFSDFGRGFYLTDNKGLAKTWARRVSFGSSGASAVLTFFADFSSITVRRLTPLEDEWKNIVYEQRVQHRDFLKEDCVVAPIADGKRLARLIRSASRGLIGKEEFCRAISEKVIGVQYVFKRQTTVNDALFFQGKEVF